MEPIEILTTQQMAQADQLTIDAGDASITAIALMENAGRAVAEAIQQRWTPCAVCVLCGPGNNGGDGFVVARLLAEDGWPVRVAVLGEKASLKNEARHHAGRWQSPIDSLNPAVLEGAELVVDALFGAGLSRALQGPALETLVAAAAMRLPIVAIDVPSGLEGNTGGAPRAASSAVPSALTVTFFRKKPAHLLYPGRQLCGEVVVSDIGIASGVLTAIHPQTFENLPGVWWAHFPRPDEASHKYTRGHALVYGGYPVTGASRLAARGAARAGAGLTSIAVPETAYSVYAAALESIMVHPISSAEGFDALLSDKRVTALLIGPGAGASNAAALDKTRARVLTMLAKGKATVLDADAISAFQHELPALVNAIKGPCVLTPHEGEFSRLFGSITDAGADKLSRARQAALHCNAVIVLKGADTVIAAPDGRAAINSNAPASLATGGSGDVLGGIILGLLAQGMPAFEAAAAGVWLHSEAASEFGPGLIAEDLPEMVPRVLQRLSVYSAD